MTRVRALSLLCPEENQGKSDGACEEAPETTSAAPKEDDNGDAAAAQEFDIEIGSRFTPGALVQVLRSHCNTTGHRTGTKRSVFSRAGIWRGPLSALPPSFPLQLPSSLPVLELVLLPEEDDGSLDLSLARAQLSVPLLPERALKRDSTSLPDISPPSATAAASSLAGATAAPGPESSSAPSILSVSSAGASVGGSDNAPFETLSHIEDGGRHSPSDATAQETGSNGADCVGGTENTGEKVVGPSAAATATSTAAALADVSDDAQSLPDERFEQGKTPVASFPSKTNGAPDSGPNTDINNDNGKSSSAQKVAVADTASSAAETSQRHEQTKLEEAAAVTAVSLWGLEIDVVTILEREKGKDSNGSGQLSEEKRRNLARDALHSGDVDRLLLCLGRLEGEAPRVAGGRADRFDDPVAVADRARRRQEEGEGRKSVKDDAAEAPMWAPPFPPEEYDDYDDEAFMENQDFSVGGGGAVAGGALPPLPSHSTSAAGGSRIWQGGQQPSADLVETTRRLLQALNNYNVGGRVQHGSERDLKKTNVSEGKYSTVPQQRDSKADGTGPDAETSTLKGTASEAECMNEAGTNGGSTDGTGSDYNDRVLASAVLEESCLRSVCRQYMFGVDWRFVSAHRHFYRALLLLLRDILSPSVSASKSGQRLTSTGIEQAEHGPQYPLARSLLATSSKCPGLVELLSNLCVALDDLVACPPQVPAPLPPTPTPTPLPPPASPAVTHPPPSPASPHPTLAQLTQTPATAAAVAAAASANAYFASFVSSGLVQNMAPTASVAAASVNTKQKASVPVSAENALSHDGIAATAAAAATMAHSSFPSFVPSGASASPAYIPVQAADPFVPPVSVSMATPSFGEVPAPSAYPDGLPPLAPTHGLTHNNNYEANVASTSSTAAPTASDGAAALAEVGVTPEQQAQPSVALPPSGAASPTPTPPPLLSPPHPLSVWPTTAGSSPAADPAAKLGSPPLAPQQVPTPPPLPPPPLLALIKGVVKPAVDVTAARAAEEAARKVQYEKENKEHEEGMELAAIARAVLDQAKAVDEAKAPTATGGGVRSTANVDDNHTQNGQCVTSESNGGTEESKGGELAGGAVAGAVSGQDEEDEVPPAEELYLAAMEGGQFGTMRMETSTSCEPSNGKPEQQHHFWKVAMAEGPAPPARQRRLVRELRSLARELPLYWGSTVAVRVDEERPHLLKAMIAAPDGTPYDSGLFQFDIYCPPQYPNVPPRVNLMTTGRGTVRFNPNLYPCGNVCLSLLGTWSGSPEMMWSPDASLLQVLLSIQTFILGAQYPYYNEPGLELDFGNPGSMDRARTSPNGGYELLRPATVEWAMTEALRHPPRGFEELAREHLWRKKWHILEVVTDWLREGRNPGGLPGHYRDLLASLQGFIKELMQLSKTAGNCPIELARPAGGDNQQVDRAVDGDDEDETSGFDRVEFMAAMRGLFGPEAGPPRRAASSQLRPLLTTVSYGKGNSQKGAGSTTSASATDGQASVGGDERDQTQADNIVRGDTVAGRVGMNSNDTAAETKADSDEGTGIITAITSMAPNGGTDDRATDDSGNGEHEIPTNGSQQQVQTERRNNSILRRSRRRWETPEAVRERLRFRLKMISRRLDVAIASTAAGPPRRMMVEPWGIAAGKVARAAGVGSLHGKALTAEEALAGGRPGVTWSSHPHFGKYFVLIKLGIPREEVVAVALRNGVDPYILEHGDEEIPMSTQYGVLSPCAPLLRVSPDLASTPVAQLTASSGIIYTADPSKGFGRSSCAPPTGTATPATDPAANSTSDDSLVAARKPTTNGANSKNPGSFAADAAAFETSSFTASATTPAVTPAAGTTVGGPTESTEPCKPCEAYRHPLVLSGRRVWVVSPVVGWASVWAETRQNILRPAAELEMEERAARKKAAAAAAAGVGKTGKGKGKGKGKMLAPTNAAMDFLLSVKGKAGGGGSGGYGGGSEEQGEDDDEDGGWGIGLLFGGEAGGEKGGGGDMQAKSDKSEAASNASATANAAKGLPVMIMSTVNGAGSKPFKMKKDEKPEAWPLAAGSVKCPPAQMPKLAGQATPAGASKTKNKQSGSFLLDWLSAPHPGPPASAAKAGASSSVIPASSNMGVAASPGGPAAAAAAAATGTFASHVSVGSYAGAGVAAGVTEEISTTTMMSTPVLFGGGSGGNGSGQNPSGGGSGWGGGGGGSGGGTAMFWGSSFQAMSMNEEEKKTE